MVRFDPRVAHYEIVEADDRDGRPHELAERFRSRVRRGGARHAAS